RRRVVEDGRITHAGTFNAGGTQGRERTPTDDPLAAPGAWHPAILRHPANGRGTLYLGRRRDSYVEGLARGDAAGLAGPFLRRGVVARGVRRAAGSAVGTRPPAALPLRALMAPGRSCDVGQPL